VVSHELNGIFTTCRQDWACAEGAPAAVRKGTLRKGGAMKQTSQWVDPYRHSAAAVRSRPPETSVLHVDGPLHARQGAELRNEIHAWLRRGHRAIVLGLAGVSEIDAAGMGELARAYNLAVAAGGTLRITQPTPRVREILDRVGLLDILTGV